MIKKPIVAANWKMYKTPQEGVDFISELRNLLLDKEKPTIIFCPPFTSLFHMNEMISDLDMSLGAQNVYFEKEGAFTGEISVNMLKSCSVQYVIIGHSERRHIFNESNKDTNRKIHTVLDNEIIPILVQVLKNADPYSVEDSRVFAETHRAVLNFKMAEAAHNVCPRL